MHSRRVFVSATILLLAAFLTLPGCSFTEGDEGPPPVVLRTYQVPAEHQNEVYSALRSALGVTTETPFGRVSLGPSGTLIVAAPERIQAGVAEIVSADLGAASTEQDSRSIRLTYSIVVGRPLASTTQPYSVRGRIVPRLDEVLARIAEAQGPTEFAVLEEISVVSTGQTPARVGGRVAMVNQQAARRGDRIVAEIELARNASPPAGSFLGTLQALNMLNTQVTLRDGQVLVLGQAGFQGGIREAFPDADPNDQSATLYYIVAADPL